MGIFGPIKNSFPVDPRVVAKGEVNGATKVEEFPGHGANKLVDASRPGFCAETSEYTRPDGVFVSVEDVFEAGTPQGCTGPNKARHLRVEHLRAGSDPDAGIRISARDGSIALLQVAEKNQGSAYDYDNARITMSGSMMFARERVTEPVHFIVPHVGELKGNEKISELLAGAPEVDPSNEEAKMWRQQLGDVRGSVFLMSPDNPEYAKWSNENVRFYDADEDGHVDSFRVTISGGDAGAPKTLEAIGLVSDRMKYLLIQDETGNLGAVRRPSEKWADFTDLTTGEIDTLAVEGKKRAFMSVNFENGGWRTFTEGDKEAQMVFWGP